MASLSRLTTDGRDRAKRAAGRGGPSPAAEVAGRIGLGARGGLYVLIGILALRIAAGHDDGKSADKQGALGALASDGFGRVLLVLLAAGFLAYAGWRLAQAVRGEALGGPKEAAKRASSAAKGALYLAAFASSVSLLVGHRQGGGQQGGGQQGGDAQSKAWTAKVMGWPGGRALVGLVALALVAGGVALVVRGVKRKFEDHWDTSGTSEQARRVASALGVAGTASRGVVLGLVGLLLVKSAVDYDPQKAHGVDGTLRLLAAQPYGKVLLFIAAAGLVAFGLFSFAESKLRRL